MKSFCLFSDIIEGLVDGRLGRNVGGLRHMVESPPTPNLLHVSRGKVNGAYQREDSTLSNLSAKHVWQYVSSVLPRQSYHLLKIWL